MFIKLDENNYIQGYAIIGGLDGAIKIDLDESGDFIIDSKEKAAFLIKYLCYKIFKDAETNDILEASTISTLDI